MSLLADVSLTVPEFAFLAGVDRKAVDREVDVKVIPSRAGEGERKLHSYDLYYFCLVRSLRTQLDTSFRKRLRSAIVSAVAQKKPEARVDHFHVFLNEVESEILGRFQELESARTEHVESRPEVLGGAPVIKGTRLAVSHIADLVKAGAEHEELRQDFDLSDAQIDAAILYDRVTPRRGRPAAHRKRTAHVPAAR